MNILPLSTYNKLSAKKIDPMEIIKKINPNAYWLNLPSHIRIADVFYVKHLIPYMGDSSLGDDDATNSRANFLPWREWCRVASNCIFGGSGSSESSLGKFWCFRLTAPRRPNCLVDCLFVDRIGQKLSAVAPEASATAPGIAPDFPISVQEDSRVSYLSFFFFFFFFLCFSRLMTLFSII